MVEEYWEALGEVRVTLKGLTSEDLLRQVNERVEREVAFPKSPKSQ